ncbi:MAG: hypothetical protein HZB82_03560 [Deltaproteobacteria bacterium]|nr:hypothetical protein [Deltaproteobacteria bacterium]
MIHTKQIGAQEASRWFEWLDNMADFRDYALDVFSKEMTPPYAVYGPWRSAYYLVCDNGKGLLLVKAVTKADALDISFSRVFNKTDRQKMERGMEAHAWLKNALEEALIPRCRNEKIEAITATVPRKGELLFAYLEDMKIKEVIGIKRTPGYGGIRVRITLSSYAAQGDRHYS